MNITSRKLLSAAVGKAAGKPDAGQLAAINNYTLAAQTEDTVYVRTAYLAHNAIDRDREAFNAGMLEDFVKTLPGKGLFVKHPGGWDGDSGPGVGRWFQAAVVKMTQDEARAALREPGMQWPTGVKDALLLEASYYIPRTAKNTDLIADIDAGVASDVSIGFRATSRAPIENEKGEYIASVLMSPGEALEGSLVWLGAQPGARTVKAAGHKEEENTVEIEQLKAQVKSLETRATAAETKASENEQKAKAFDTVKAAVGDLADKPDELKTSVQDAKAYREELIEQAVKHRRLMGLTDDTPEAVDAAKAMYASMPMGTLKAEVASLAKKSPEGRGSQITGGDPNKGKGAGGGDGLRDSSVTRKAVGLEQAA